MRLTTSSMRSAGNAGAYRRFSRPWVIVVIFATLAGIFFLDRSTGDAPVQHLYYLPIILAALEFGRRGGVVISLAAIVLYHLANESPFLHGRTEADIVQIGLFLAVGIVTARLVGDADRMRVLATTDDLTGLHNLRSFEARLADMLGAARAAHAPLSLLVLDVDHLKSVNDKFGHLAGAEAVRTVGQTLTAHLPPDAVACRYGGDEFVVALPGRTAAQAEEIAGDLRQAVRAVAPVLAGHHLPAAALSISVGVACRSFAADAAARDADATDKQEGEALFQSADNALYKAKADGRDRVCSAEDTAFSGQQSAVSSGQHIRADVLADS
jgi:diguanylate cyclase (GGDEF)-like protein